MTNTNNNNGSAIKFVILLGFVSLFADMTYEAARSMTGPYLAILGATAAVVGLTAGIGELCGYGLRVVFGLLSDKTKQYWTFTIAGYAINLLAVPFLALANRWELAAVLIIAERIGKAVRSPAKDAMLSHAASAVGKGWGFALHEAMDQIGAMTGPIIVMIILAINGSYKFAFAALALPAVLALGVLVIARINFPQPKDLEIPAEKKFHSDKMSVIFWMYMSAVGLIAAGFADFPLIAFHVKSHDLLPDKWIPLLYAVAMGVDAMAALFFGKMYDSKGLFALMFAVGISSIFAFCAFSYNIAFIIAGVVLWGVGMGAQESIIRAVVADIVPADKRGTGYGLFNAGYGLAWFVGSAVMGILYDFSLPIMIAMSVACQAASIPVLVMVQKRMKE